jgi:hypothetical protein
MTNTDAQRIRELEGEVTRLRGELERYRPAPVVLRPGDPFVLPTLEMTEKLVGRVISRYPNLRADMERDIAPPDFVTMVRAALHYIGSLSRMKAAVNRQRDYLDWCYACDDYMTTIGKASTVRGSSFFVACIAAGDVCFTPPRLWPVTHDVGLIIGHRTDCKSATNAWMNVAAGNFDPTLVIEPHAPLNGPSRQIQMGHTNWREELRRE